MTQPLATAADRNQRLARSRSRARFTRNRTAVVGLVVVLLIVALAVFAPLVTRFDPTDTDISSRFVKPFDSEHWLGTDDLGRDLFSRLIYGARVSLVAGVGSILAALVIAVPIGLVAGYAGGWLRASAMWLVDFFLSIPALILLFAIAGILGPSLRNAVIALAVYFTPLFVRLVITEVDRLKHSQLIEAARSVGNTDVFVMRRHILPNIATPIVVQATLSLGVAVLAEASLSFLGLGVRPPTPSWGIMLNGGFDFISREPWMVIIPGTAMVVTVLAFSLVGDGLRDALGKVRA